MRTLVRPPIEGQRALVVPIAAQLVRLADQLFGPGRIAAVGGGLLTWFPRSVGRKVGAAMSAQSRPCHGGARSSVNDTSHVCVSLSAPDIASCDPELAPVMAAGLI